MRDENPNQRPANVNRTLGDLYSSFIDVTISSVDARALWDYVRALEDKVKAAKLPAKETTQ